MQEGGNDDSEQTSHVSMTDDEQPASTGNVSTSGSRLSGGSTGHASGNTASTSRHSTYGNDVTRNERLQCLVFGYTTNAQGEVRSLLLAAPERGGLRFVGKVSVDDVDPDALTGMSERFSEMVQPFPTVRSPYGGRWLKSELFCVVEFTGWAINGRLTNPFISQYAFLEPADSGT